MSIRRGTTIIANKTEITTYAAGDGINITDFVISATGAVNVDNDTITKDVNNIITTVGVQAKNGSILYDWIGTKAEWEAGRQAQTISDSWICWITDDEDESGVASAGGGPATWGSITGTLSDQTDLQTALNAKQNTLTSGVNIKTINGQSLLSSGNLDILTDTDNSTTSLNGSNEVQAIGVINSRDNSTALKTWSGTRAQFDAITSKDANTIYNVKDDNGALGLDVYSKSETNELLDDKADTTTTYTKTETNNAISTAITTAVSTLLSSVYPVGCIYIGTTATCPIASLISGSTWELVGADKVLQGAGSRGTVGNTLAESLPTHTHSGTTGNVSADHTHTRGSMEIYGYINNICSEGAMAAGGAFNIWGIGGDGVDGAGGTFYNSDFYASRHWGGSTSGISANHTHSMTTGAPSDSTYKSNAHVQPDAYLVNIWRRTA